MDDINLVSVLICINRVDHFFIRAIDSINQQTYQNHEIVLVGNTLSDSDKNTVSELSAKNPKIRLYLTEIKYLTFSLNLGLHHCKGDLIIRMDADDIAYPERIEKQVNFMKLNSDISVCGTCYYLIDENDCVLTEKLVNLQNSDIRRSMYWKNPMCHPTVIFRKNVVERFGGYMGGLYAEDYDLWNRMLHDNAVLFANIPDKLLGYRVNSTGQARRSKLAYAGMAATQLRAFVVTGNFMWLISSVVSSIKRLIFAND
jgi:glycosyltransferase involved in cell wall biosynthesis